MNAGKINAVLVSQGREAAIAVATAAGLGWAAKKIHMGEWEAARYQKSAAPKHHFLHVVVDNHEGKELVKVTNSYGEFEQFVLRWQETNESDDGRKVCTEPLGRISIAEARLRLGKSIVPPLPPSFGRKTNIGTTGTKGKSEGSSKTVTTNPTKAAKIARKQAARKG
jgi:hypothetical protein